MSRSSPLPFTPLVIIGAGRSGTNILRDTLCRLDGFASWDCDEINPVWRHGNLFADHDEFGPAEARPPVRRFIRGAFQKAWKRLDRPRYLVEKTCANSLRVPFIEAVLPEARYLFIVRDGVDVVASAQKRWRGEMEIASLPYYWAKARNTPLRDLPIYGWRFLSARASMLSGRRAHMASWGPRFRGMDARAETASLDELCAEQWARCVEASDAAFAGMDAAKVIRIRYEDMTAEPETAVRDILAFLNEDRPAKAVASAAAPVSRTSVGKGRAAMTGDTDSLMTIMAPMLDRLGYSTRLKDAA
ncbi:MAG: sulfotransferase [Pacificimonas sp.]|nr:sulfotransferase [Pacificimonas sp.]